MDYYAGVDNIGVATVRDNEFSISHLPKRKDRHLIRASYIKPKMNYKIEKVNRGVEEGISNINIYGGYGREITNYGKLLTY